MDSAVRAVGREAADGVPEPWAAADPPFGQGTTTAWPTPSTTPWRAATSAWNAARWWRAVSTLQWLLFADPAGRGLAWLVVLYVVGFLQLPHLYTPTAGDVRGRRRCLVGAAVLEVAVALLTRAWPGSAAAGRPARSARVLRQNISEVAEQMVIAPDQPRADPLRHRLAQAQDRPPC